MLPTGFHVPPDTITRIWRTFTETGRIGAEDAALTRRGCVPAGPLTVAPCPAAALKHSSRVGS